jgi:hypothetical protein
LTKNVRNSTDFHEGEIIIKVLKPFAHACHAEFWNAIYVLSPVDRSGLSMRWQNVFVLLTSISTTWMRFENANSVTAFTLSKRRNLQIPGGGTADTRKDQCT